MTRKCREEGCEVTWEVTKAAGRPRVWCSEHGTTAAATRRSRAEPQDPKPSCCPVRGKCPQHREMPKIHTVRNAKATWQRNGETISDLVAVFGHAVILSERGWQIKTWLPPEDDE